MFGHTLRFWREVPFEVLHMVQCGQLLCCQTGRTSLRLADLMHVLSLASGKIQFNIFAPHCIFTCFRSQSVRTAATKLCDFYSSRVWKEYIHMGGGPSLA